LAHISEGAKKQKRQEGYWLSKENRQKFLLSFAENMGFDPNVVDNWHNTASRLRANEVR